MLRLDRSSRLAAVAVAALVTCGLGAASAAPARVSPERALAGVRIGSRGITVLQRFGEPTAVTIGQAAPDQNAAGGFGATSAPSGYGGPSPYPTSNPYASGPSAYRAGPGALPPAGGAGPYGPGGGAGPYGPGGGSAPAFGSTNGDAGTEQDFSTRLITWTYRYPKQGIVLDFQLDEDGRVVQIVATGLRPTSMVRTARGVTFGDSYSKVLKLYGFPESQSQPGSGSVVMADYRNRARVAFQFINLKVARIVVAELQ